MELNKKNMKHYIYFSIFSLFMCSCSELDYNQKISSQPKHNPRVDPIEKISFFCFCYGKPIEKKNLDGTTSITPFNCHTYKAVSLEELCSNYHWKEIFGKKVNLIKNTILSYSNVTQFKKHDIDNRLAMVIGTDTLSVFKCNKNESLLRNRSQILNYDFSVIDSIEKILGTTIRCSPFSNNYLSK